MVFSRPLLSREQLLLGLDLDGGGGSSPRGNYVVDRPAGDGLPEVVRIVDVAEDLPINVSSDEEEMEVGEFLGVRPMSDDDVADDEDTDSEEDDWTSEDSGYDTMTDDEDMDSEEEVEEEDRDVEENSGYDGDGDDDVIRPRSPLDQQMPSEDFWHGCRRVDPPVPCACPRHPIPEERPEDGPQRRSLAGPRRSEPPVPQRFEDSAPSTSGLSSATKRSREESDTEQVSAKRHRWNLDGGLDESAPSTSGLGRSTSGSREANHEESAPSTSVGGSHTFRRLWLGPFLRWTDDSDSD
ncbi:midasin-like [Anabas testudineus]|uniref:midasin-like n=1 Tax=Anabas testudineus TaxID=64144 RepID=UPI000E45A6ED|nr:midasin-like [Anabas testudineus]